jgi:hypothetical protein
MITSPARSGRARTTCGSSAASTDDCALSSGAMRARAALTELMMLSRARTHRAVGTSQRPARRELVVITSHVVHATTTNPIMPKTHVQRRR